MSFNFLVSGTVASHCGGPRRKSGGDGKPNKYSQLISIFLVSQSNIGIFGIFDHLDQKVGAGQQLEIQQSAMPDQFDQMMEEVTRWLVMLVMLVVVVMVVVMMVVVMMVAM